ncbi:stalk domain-containing protein [Paenibacillus sp. An7]|uniref:stalk domain-containing protein n=1 Tax=Paenibacillus sp. An7 TaxID=2689577 RepID=UPI00135CA6C3|nr:stalk domain-containing protein [Paenibacillus sp. An7]
MIIQKNKSMVVSITTVLFLLLMMVFPTPELANAASKADSKNIELLRSDNKIIDGKMKVTADVRVQKGEKVSLFVIGYDKAGSIIEMKQTSKYIFSGNTSVFQLTMDNGEELNKLDIQALGATEEPYKILAQTTIKHEDHVEAVVAIKNGPKSQKMNIVAKGLNTNGKVVEVKSDGSHAFEQSVLIYKIEFEAVNDIAKVQFLVLVDDKTYLVDSGLYIKDGKLVLTSVIKNGTKSQQILTKVTPFTADGKELEILTRSSYAFSNSTHDVRMVVDDTSANRVNITFYDETGKNEIKKLKSIMVTIDGNELAVNQSPVMKQGNVSVPMRDIFEALGADVKWDQKTSTITATRGSKEVILRIGSKLAYIDGVKATLSVEPAIINGSTMVPIRFVAEALGAKVTWDNESQTVIITR